MLSHTQVTNSSTMLQVKTLITVITTSPFYASLPGPARMQLVDTLITSLAQETIWSPLSPEGCTCVLIHAFFHARTHASTYISYMWAYMSCMHGCMPTCGQNGICSCTCLQLLPDLGSAQRSRRSMGLLSSRLVQHVLDLMQHRL